jgi:hypothetical protein
VFDDFGMTRIDVQQTNTEDFESYSAPVYQSVSTLTCVAPSAAGGMVSAINEIDVTNTTP